MESGYVTFKTRSIVKIGVTDSAKMGTHYMGFFMDHEVVVINGKGRSSKEATGIGAYISRVNGCIGGHSNDFATLAGAGYTTGSIIEVPIYATNIDGLGMIHVNSNDVVVAARGNV
ncbi:hypothetical protein QAD02_003150 [Eretmocerus hayati]|uniref:Uncharacterized protein n=1 Tax=Eretmocerus hayati TaxID=131215 RepID=A0ACC2NMN9_9HYME|nr:hypothetical protein QAD02_003150 [Eretmocerus hayati]